MTAGVEMLLVHFQKSIIFDYFNEITVIWRGKYLPIIGVSWAEILEG
jgi:hypothetical protein